MRDRTFLQRGQPVTFQELTAVIALRQGAGEHGAQSDPGVCDAIAQHVPLAQVRAFEVGGWSFQRRPSSLPPKSILYTKVFINPHGQLSLGTNFLTVQLQGNPSERDANDILQPFGARIERTLRFAPGLFYVAVTEPEHRDAIDVANELIRSGVAHLADPEFIDNIGPR
jgi:hypothetical protein